MSSNSARPECGRAPFFFWRKPWRRHTVGLLRCSVPKFQNAQLTFERCFFFCAIFFWLPRGLQGEKKRKTYLYACPPRGDPKQHKLQLVSCLVIFGFFGFLSKTFQDSSSSVTPPCVLQDPPAALRPGPLQDSQGHQEDFAGLSWHVFLHKGKIMTERTFFIGVSAILVFRCKVLVFVGLTFSFCFRLYWSSSVFVWSAGYWFRICRSFRLVFLGFWVSCCFLFLCLPVYFFQFPKYVPFFSLPKSSFRRRPETAFSSWRLPALPEWLNIS